MRERRVSRKSARGKQKSRRPSPPRKRDWGRPGITAGVLIVIAAAIAVAIVWGRRHEAPDMDQVARAVRGAQLYAEHCASCHGAELEGEPNWREPLPDGSWPAPPHDETGHTWHHPDGFLFDVVKLGGPVQGRQSNMPAFREKLSDGEIWAVLEFIKSRWPPSVREHQARLRRRRSRL